MAPSSSSSLHGYTSRRSPKNYSWCVEPDLEIIDLEGSKSTPKSSQLSRTRLIQIGSETIPCSLRLRHAEADLEALAQKMESLEGLSKAELCEVRQLARNPPEYVRRLVFAIWLVLNCERFRDQSVVNLNEGRGWALCQKMLADRAFVSRLYTFDLSSLDEVPHVLTHLARTFFGIDNTPVLENLHTEVASNRCASDGAIRHSLSGNLSLHTSISGSLLSKAGHEGRQRAHNISNCIRSSRLTKPMSSLTLPHLPLDQNEVQHASEPCGALLRWLRTLVLDRARRACIQHDLSHAEEKLSSAESICRDAELQVAELQADIEMNRKHHAHQEQTIQTLRQAFVQPPSRMCEGKGAWNLSDARMRPRSRCRVTKPPCDITLKTLTLQNATWRETFERYSVPGSPSWSRTCSR